MLREVVSRLVGLLGLHVAGREKIAAALFGEGDTAVTMAGHVIVLEAIPENGYLKRYPIVVVRNGHDAFLCECRACRETRTHHLEKEGFASGKLVTTEGVANFFRGRSPGIGTVSFPATWAPAATDSFAPVTIAGDLAEAVEETADVEHEANRYQWFDLTAVPVNGSVWRLSSTRTLWLFIRESEGWLVVCVPNASWATTDPRHGETRDFGSLLHGALEALRTVEAMTDVAIIAPR